MSGSNLSYIPELPCFGTDENVHSLHDLSDSYYTSFVFKTN
jgi:hypothetical protein